MAPTHVELYEALKPTVGEKAAAMIADVVPPASELATKSDLLALENHLTGKVSHLETALADVRAEMRGVKWLLGLLVPMVAGTWGTLVAVLLKI